MMFLSNVTAMLAKSAKRLEASKQILIIIFFGHFKMFPWNAYMISKLELVVLTLLQLFKKNMSAFLLTKL